MKICRADDIFVLLLSYNLKKKDTNTLYNFAAGSL